MINDIQKILAFQLGGFISSSEVVSWADNEILLFDGDDLPEWLMDLSGKGPKRFMKLFEPDYPRPMELSYLETFRLMIEVTDPDHLDSLKNFTRWIAIRAMGEDINLNEVRVGYEIEHAISYDNSGDSIAMAKDVVLRYKLVCNDIADCLGGLKNG